MTFDLLRRLLKSSLLSNDSNVRAQCLNTIENTPMSEGEYGAIKNILFEIIRKNLFLKTEIISTLQKLLNQERVSHSASKLTATLLRQYPSPLREGYIKNVLPSNDEESEDLDNLGENPSDDEKKESLLKRKREEKTSPLEIQPPAKHKKDDDTSDVESIGSNDSDAKKSDDVIELDERSDGFDDEKFIPVQPIPTSTRLQAKLFEKSSLETLSQQPSEPLIKEKKEPKKHNKKNKVTIPQTTLDELDAKLNDFIAQIADTETSESIQNKLNDMGYNPAFTATSPIDVKKLHQIRGKQASFLCEFKKSIKNGVGKNRINSILTNLKKTTDLAQALWKAYIARYYIGMDTQPDGEILKEKLSTFIKAECKKIWNAKLQQAPEIETTIPEKETPIKEVPIKIEPIMEDETPTPSRFSNKLATAAALDIGFFGNKKILIPMKKEPVISTENKQKDTRPGNTGQ